MSPIMLILVILLILIILGGGYGYHSGHPLATSPHGLIGLVVLVLVIVLVLYLVRAV